MKKPMFAALALSAAATISLTACDNQTDANEKNFSAALNQHFEKTGDLCLGILFWPQEARKTEADGRHIWLAALAKKGLLNVEDTEVSSIWNNKTKVHGKRYSPSDTAKPFLRESDLSDHEQNILEFLKLDDPDLYERLPNNGKKNDLCWGKMHLDKIVKWDTPDASKVTVFYTYKIDDFADWAKDKDIRDSLNLNKKIEEAGVEEKTITLHLTNLGWEVR
ncbi:hypothetical protein AGMMS49543_28350 [Betaproteobacteria bacterium]|nr:hypothetical protein AGMMS49543_28350 [Betaproteobacteria bacterium]GHU25246.1 hypothetical protein AGMMS50243_29040 [Betaproteobacteria bacterium]